jgi:predicted P-loop ATPase
VKTGTIDTDSLARDRDHLFAEAVARYRDGEKWWPDATFETDVIRPEQDARFEVDAWESTIVEYLSDKATVLVGQIARDALNIETPRIGTADQRRITAVLERLGWQRQRKDWKGNIAWARTTDHG